MSRSREMEGSRPKESGRKSLRRLSHRDHHCKISLEWSKFRFGNHHPFVKAITGLRNIEQVEPCMLEEALLRTYRSCIKLVKGEAYAISFNYPFPVGRLCRIFRRWLRGRDERGSSQSATFDREIGNRARERPRLHARTASDEACHSEIDSVDGRRSRGVGLA